MNKKVFPLNDKNENLILTAYLLEDSAEYRINEKKPAVLICPGGGYQMTSDREADPVALRFLSRGYHAFILRYSTAQNGGALFPKPLLDAGKAMLEIHKMADEAQVDTENIAVCGFSAGANLAALLATRWQDPLLSEGLNQDSSLFRPSLLISGYGMLDYPGLMQWAKDDPLAEKKEAWGSKMDLWRACNSTLFGTEDPTEDQMKECSPTHHVSENTPPAFIWHTVEDNLVYVQNSLNFAAALSRNNRPYEMHLFESGGHGLSLADETSSNSDWQMEKQSRWWMDLCISWMKKRTI